MCYQCDLCHFQISHFLSFICQSLSDLTLFTPSLYILQVRCVEFQKRGLPHAHILLILSPDDALRDVNDWDTAVSAELPDEDQFPEVCFGLHFCGRRLARSM